MPKASKQPNSWTSAVLALVLPFPEREEAARHAWIDVPLWSFLIGLVELIVGGLVLFADWHSSIQELTARLMGDVAAADPNFGQSFEERWVLNWSGGLTSLVYFFRPTTWLLASIPLTGMVRTITFAASRQASGEFFVWLFVRAAQLVGGQAGKAKRSARFGPLRPDRFVREPGSDVVLLTCRPQSGWNESVTIEIRERFYQLTGVEERRPPGESWYVYAYKLREQPENAIIRSLYRYEPLAVPRGKGS